MGNVQGAHRALVLLCLILFILTVIQYTPKASSLTFLDVPFVAADVRSTPTPTPTPTIWQPGPGSPPAIHTFGVEMLNLDTGSVLYANNADGKFQMASTTKMMTALLAAEHNVLNNEVTITQEDVQLGPDAASVGLQAGEKYKVRDLLYAMSVQSANDAANAVGTAVGGTLSNFIDMMNNRAKQLGMRNTHFISANGYAQGGVDSGHYSTAHDMALLMLNFSHWPELVSIFNATTYHVDQTTDHKGFDIARSYQYMISDSWNGIPPGDDSSHPMHAISLPFTVDAIKKGCMDCTGGDGQISYVLLAHYNTERIAAAFLGTSQNYFDPHQGDILPLLFWGFGLCNTQASQGFC